MTLPPSFIVFENLSIFREENQPYKPQNSFNLTIELEWNGLCRDVCREPSTPPLFAILEMLTWFREFRTSHKCRVRQSTYQSCLLRRTTWCLAYRQNSRDQHLPAGYYIGQFSGDALFYVTAGMLWATQRPNRPYPAEMAVQSLVICISGGAPPEIPSGAGTSNDSRHRGWRACGGVACSSATLSQTPCVETRPRRRERSRTRNH